MLADTSTLTLSRVMMPWDWIGIVMIRNGTPAQDVDDRDDQPQPRLAHAEPAPARGSGSGCRLGGDALA
ncbi:hypothetical protein ACFVYA_31540 [Amycolatopsis sp. NPDC058278]|uniref:hypothetical protein n=1 Tax=Amycolatopsis sp. NPDC058278 TaxID=3346417 RepID=UPI0036D80D5E